MKKLASLGLWVLALLNLESSQAWAKLKVVATLPSFADIAREVGGSEVQVVALTRGTQDPHFVDAKPDLILELRNADLLIHTGLGLEDGWLPQLMVGSRNSKIQAGSQGNFNVSSSMSLKETPRSALDRSQGDVHPGGNPHFMADPRNGVVLAQAIATRLAQLEPSKSADFESRAEQYSKKLKSKIQEWQADLKSLEGTPVVTYHRSWIYMTSWAGLEEVGYVEPKPGVPPAPDHVMRLVRLMKEKNVKLILMEPFYPKGTAEEVARLTGAKLLVLPVEVNGSSQAKTYFDVFSQMVGALKAFK